MSEMEKSQAKQYSPLGLAYIGDGIYELMVREMVVELGNRPVNLLHRMTVSCVCASAQAKAYDMIEPLLTEEEVAIYKRGRNANGNHVPKNANLADYRKATGLESLFGYLHLIGDNERVRYLFDIIFSDRSLDAFTEVSISERAVGKNGQKEKRAKSFSQKGD